MRRSAISKFGHVADSKSAADIVNNTDNIETNTQSINNLQTQINTEVSRASSAENTLQASINANTTKLNNYQTDSFSLQNGSFDNMITLGSFTQDNDNPFQWNSGVNQNMTTNANTGSFDQNSTGSTAWLYSETFTPYTTDYDINIQFSVVSGSRVYVSFIGNDETFSSTSLLYQDAITVAISAFGANKFLRIRNNNVEQAATDLGPGDYPSNTLLTFKVRSRVVTVYIDSLLIVTTTQFIVNNTAHRISIKDTNTQVGDIAGVATYNVLDPMLTVTTGSKFYENKHVHFERDLQVIHNSQDTFVKFNSTNNRIDVLKDIQAQNILANSLISATSMYPAGSTAKMLSLNAYTGQFYYNTDVNKMCVWSGNTWQVPGETVELLNSEIVAVGQVMVTDITANQSCAKVTTTLSTDVIGVVAWTGKSSATQAYVTIATHGVWSVGVISAIYTRGQYLASDSSGWAYEKTTVSNTFGFILESKTTASNGELLTALIRSIA